MSGLGRLIGSLASPGSGVGRVAIVLCLNELSCGSTVEHHVADDAMIEFVEILRGIWRWRGNASLLSAVRLPDLELSVGYYLRQWINADPKNGVRWDFLRSLQNRAPFADAYPEDMEGLIEHRFRGALAEGLGAADLLSGLAVSLAIDDVWDAPYLRLDRLMLVEGSNEYDEQVDEVDVRHAVRMSQAEEHRTWLEETQLAEIISGNDIWHNKAAMFPCLSFLPRVESDLRDMARASVKFVVEKLAGIDSAVSEWQASGSALPGWRTAVKPEYEQREAYCEFEDLDGVVRVFELHVRFPPPPGRIHFRLVSDERGARIAYIGRKLGV